MKKFTKILACFMLFVLAFAFVSCDKRTEEEKNFTYPSSWDETMGNGGLAVRKGDYVYFVNGYTSITTSGLTKDSTYSVGSLMLMKLDANGNVVTNEAGLLKDEYYITMSNKLCGYEATNLYIHGDYLYFATPCLENETGDEVWAKERVTINRIKLNKTGDVEEVYSSGVKVDNFNYDYYEANGNLYILAWEEGDSYYAENGNNALIRIDATAKSSSVISTGVSSVAFADNFNEIFYVYDDTSDYDLKQYDIASNVSTDFVSNNSTTLTVKAAANGKVVYTTAHDYFSTQDIVVKNISDKSELYTYAYNGTGDVYLTNDGFAVVLVNENVISLITGKDKVETITDVDASTIKVVDFTNGCILYYDTNDNGSSIKLVSYSNAIAGSTAEIITLTTIEKVNEDVACFDFSEDENRLYFYNNCGESASKYYLNRIKVNNNFGETEEMFGVYDGGDEPVEEEVEEEIEEE